MLVLALLVLLTSVGVVYAKYASRRYFVELEAMRASQDTLDVEWGQLKLEQSTWATHHRIEQVARKKLKMHIPTAADIMVVRP
ncbi:MAG: cell division protein FtsL [Gammaproteobacteria bacterium]|nr:cell division protein FtsL [Gammaproteobacteria bacterium]